MRLFFLSLVFVGIGLLFPLSSSCQQWEWVKSSGGVSRDEAELPAVDPWGNVIICGKFSDTAWFGSSYLISSGGRDLFLAKYDPQGNLLWLLKGGSTHDAEGLSIAADKHGNVAVTGFYKGTLSIGTNTFAGDPVTNSLFVAMIDSSGAVVWAKNANGGAIQGKGIEFDPDGNVLVTGHYRDSIVFSPSTVLHSIDDQNAFLAKFSPTGVFQWANHGGGQYRAWASSVGVDSQGNSYITGAFRDTVNFGSHTIITFGLNDVFLAKCSPTGNWIWAVNAGGTSDDFGNGIEVDVFDHIAVTGSFIGTVSFPPLGPVTTYGDKDGFIAYYSPDGLCVWMDKFGGPAEDKGIGVSTDNAGNIYVTGFVKNVGNFGNIQLTTAGGDDVSLVKYSRTGDVLWADLAGGSLNDYGKGIQVYQQGIIYVAGYYQGTATFGTNTIVAHGDREAYVAKYYDGSPLFAAMPQSQNLCVEDSLILEVQLQTSGNYNFEWYNDTTLLAAFTGNRLAILCTDTLQSGKYYCIVSDSNAVAVSDTAFVIVSSKPLINIGNYVFVSADDTLTLDAGPGFSSYLWNIGDTTQKITYPASDLAAIFSSKSGIITGWINVEVTDLNGCKGIDSIEVNIIYSVEEHDMNALHLNVFPNPGSGNIHIVCSHPIERLELFSLTGQKLYDTSVIESEVRSTQIDFSGQAKGIYLIKISTKNGILSRKLILGND